jgi:hypothetical protein
MSIMPSSHYKPNRRKRNLHGFKYAAAKRQSGKAAKRQSGKAAKRQNALFG